VTLSGGPSAGPAPDDALVQQGRTLTESPSGGGAGVAGTETSGDPESRRPGRKIASCYGVEARRRLPPATDDER
jgi:hypothetical protein